MRYRGSTNVFSGRRLLRSGQRLRTIVRYHFFGSLRQVGGACSVNVCSGLRLFFLGLYAVHRPVIVVDQRTVVGGICHQLFGGVHIVRQLEAQGAEKPTHLFLQAGVGALAGAVTGFFADYYKDNRPIITIVEPDKADCIYKTADANDGRIHTVGGDLNTIMAGLACGEPCTIGWNVLHDHADHFISMSDNYAELGMRTLGLPLGNDQVIVSGESGAATMGFVTEILSNPEHKELKEALQLNEDSIIICISTEGDTDKENYRKIVWEGYYPSY